MRQTMVKHSRLLFAFITVLGIAFLTLLFAYPEALLILPFPYYFAYFCVIGGIGFLTVGLCGLGRKSLLNQTIKRHSRLRFGCIAVLGAVFVTVFFTIIYWSNTFSVEILIVDALIPSPYQMYFMLFSIIGGTIFLTVGILGVGGQYFKNHTHIFFLTAVLVPMLMLGSFASMMSVFSDPFYEVPERIVITQIALSNTNPLTLSLTAKSFYSREIDFVEAQIKDADQATVASIEAKWVTVEYNEWGPVSRMQFIGQLPGGSEKTLTFDFNTTLPSGNYSVWLSSRRYYTFVSPQFTIS